MFIFRKLGFKSREQKYRAAKAELEALQQMKVKKERRRRRNDLMLLRTPERCFFLINRTARLPVEKPSDLVDRTICIETGMRGDDYSRWSTVFFATVTSVKLLNSEVMVLTLNCPLFVKDSYQIRFSRLKKSDGWVADWHIKGEITGLKLTLF